MNKALPRKINIISAVKNPLICGIVCGFAAFTAYSMLENRIGAALNVLFSILIGAFVYIISLILMGVFRTNGLIMLKNGKKFKKPLAKSRKIG